MISREKVKNILASQKTGGSTQRLDAPSDERRRWSNRPAHLGRLPCFALTLDARGNEEMATLALRGCASLAGRARTLLGAGVAGPRVLIVGASLSGPGERKYSVFAAAAVARAAPVPRPPGLESVRAFRPSFPAADSVTIAVPEMGDSITEGEIAAIVKQPGGSSSLAFRLRPSRPPSVELPPEPRRPRFE